MTEETIGERSELQQHASQAALDEVNELARRHQAGNCALIKALAEAQTRQQTSNERNAIYTPRRQ